MAKTILTIKQTARGFAISTMALLNWRKGQVGKKPLPAVEKTRGANGKSVGFDLEVVKKWAAKHELSFDEKAATTEPKEAKRGPVKKAATAIKQSPPKKASSAKAQVAKATRAIDAQYAKDAAKSAAKPVAALLKPKGTPIATKPRKFGDAVATTELSMADTKKLLDKGKKPTAKVVPMPTKAAATGTEQAAAP